MHELPTREDNCLDYIITPMGWESSISNTNISDDNTVIAEGLIDKGSIKKVLDYQEIYSRDKAKKMLKYMLDTHKKAKDLAFVRKNDNNYIWCRKKPKFKIQKSTFF